jgi:hypothetical protein
MTTQSVASVVRQVLAVLVSVYGVLTASVTALHLPPAVSTALVAFGPVLLSIEHFVADPSTGTATAAVDSVPELKKLLAEAEAKLKSLEPTPVVAPSVPGNAGSPVSVPVVPAPPPPPTVG